MTLSGWDVPETKNHKWEQAVELIDNHIRSLNWGYGKALREENIDYHNKLASIVDHNTIELTDAEGKKETVKAEKIVIATGGRPTYPDIPGAVKHSITSDDLFWMNENPKKTLIIGASYIALECAGFLNALGIDVTVMVRSIFLRGFDQQLANKVG